MVDAPPLEESEQEVARRGMFVTRSHRSVTSLTSGLNGSESPPADGKKAEVTVEVTRRGKFVTRTHHSVSPLTTEVILLSWPRLWWPYREVTSLPRDTFLSSYWSATRAELLYTPYVLN